MTAELVISILMTWIISKTGSAIENPYTDLHHMGNFYKASRLCHGRGQSVPHGNSTSLEHFMHIQNVSSTWLNIRLHDLEIWTWVNGIKDREFCESCKGCAKISMMETTTAAVDCAALNVGFICQIEGRCPKDQNFPCKMVKGKTLLIGCYTKNWFTGRSTCINFSGDLLIIDNSIKATLLNNILPNVKCQNRQTEYFIGLRRVEWFAVGPQDERELVDHTKWQDEHPSHSQECVEIEKVDTASQFGWKTKDCFQENPIICQGYLAVSAKPNLSMLGETDNPAKKEWSDDKIAVPAELFYFLVVLAVLPSLALIIWLILVCRRNAIREKAPRGYIPEEEKIELKDLRQGML